MHGSIEVLPISIIEHSVKSCLLYMPLFISEKEAYLLNLTSMRKLSDHIYANQINTNTENAHSLNFTMKPINILSDTSPLNTNPKFASFPFWGILTIETCNAIPRDKFRHLRYGMNCS